MRLALERELIEAMTPTVARMRPVVLVVHADARGDHDTSVPA